jgi:hypothetical protein
MVSTSANKNVVVVNDEVISFEQYNEEFLMEAWFRMQGSVEDSPNVHTQGFIIKDYLMV